MCACLVVCFCVSHVVVSLIMAAGNAFVELPEDLQRLRALVHLDVSGNPRLSALPTALASMPALRRVSLHGSRVDATAARRLLPEGIVIDADPR